MAGPGPGPGPGPDRQLLAKTGPESEGQLLEGPHEQLLAARGGQILTLRAVCTATGSAGQEMSSVNFLELLSYSNRKRLLLMLDNVM